MHNVNPLNTADPTFGEFRRSLDAEMKRLHGMGLGVKTNQAEPLSPDDEAILWSKGLFGSHNGEALLNTVYFYNCKVFGLRSYDEHRNLSRSQYTKKLDEKGRVYIEYVDFGNKCNRGGLKHMKVDNKVVRRYEDENDPDHDLVNLFVKYLHYLPDGVDHFYCRAMKDDGSGVPRFGKQAVGRNKLAQIIPVICKAAGIEGHKRRDIRVR